jgi:hypothetical protein
MTNIVLPAKTFDPQFPARAAPSSKTFRSKQAPKVALSGALKPLSYNFFPPFFHPTSHFTPGEL